MANRKHASSDAELIESKDWGVPNWKIKDGYPKKWDKLHPDKQKWEFLRRTKDYRYDWKRAQSPVLPTAKAVSKFHTARPFDEKALAAKYGMSHPVPPQNDYKNLPVGFHFKRPTLSGGKIVHPRCPVPNQPEDKNIKKVPKSEWEKKLAVYAEEACKGLWDPPTDWYEMRAWVEFDLSESIDDQIAIAKQNLIKKAGELEVFMDSLRNPEEKYALYDHAPLEVRARKGRAANKKSKQPIEESPAVSMLRIFDAKNCGRNNTQITHGLYACTGESIDTSTVSKRHKVAVQLWKRL